jgi:hypothetical protein
MNVQRRITEFHSPVGQPDPASCQGGDEMKGSLVQRLCTWAQGRVGRFLLTQIAHTTITAAVLTALLLGAARVGALDGVLSSSAAPATGSSFTTVNYQGRLADASGNPIDNTNPGVGMTFALYTQETGGSPVWIETHANVPVSEGLFSVRLGSINALSTDLLTGDRWLGIQVGTDPEMTPREKLAAVPYAMQALTVPDGAITSRKLDLDEAYQYVEAWEATDSTEWTDLPTPHSVTISLDVPQFVYVLYGAMIKNLNNGVSYMGISVDGQPVSDDNKIEYGGNVDAFSRASITGVSRFYLSAGTHTITAKYTVSSGTGQFWHRRILVAAVAQ